MSRRRASASSRSTDCRREYGVLISAFPTLNVFQVS
jgi:hypothetical protein